MKDLSLPQMNRLFGLMKFRKRGNYGTEDYARGEGQLNLLNKTVRLQLTTHKRPLWNDESKRALADMECLNHTNSQARFAATDRCIQTSVLLIGAVILTRSGLLLCLKNYE